ncbi:hypothetical protein [Streptomyces sp. NPDC012616]|uniref:hypothetical protein n=1 Tax=Streptomyces sp. NPDC012616 TaxID=3364840 RepID=UPI0036E86F60
MNSKEIEVVQAAVSELESEGWSVHLYPDRKRLPESLGEFSPEFIAIRKGEHVLGKISCLEDPSRATLVELASRVSELPKWRLELVWMGSSQPHPEIKPMYLLKAEAERLASHDGMHSIMLAHEVATAILIQLDLLDGGASRDTLASYASSLYSSGRISKWRYSAFMSLATARNEVVHGGRASKKTFLVVHRGLEAAWSLYPSPPLSSFEMVDRIESHFESSEGRGNAAAIAQAINGAFPGVHPLDVVEVTEILANTGPHFD